MGLNPLYKIGASVNQRCKTNKSDRLKTVLDTNCARFNFKSCLSSINNCIITRETLIYKCLFDECHGTLLSEERGHH